MSQAELETFADIVVTDATEADDQISQAEEIIDSYVGYQERFLDFEISGRCSSAGGSTFFYLESDALNVYDKDYFVGCEVEILGGTGVGQRRRITGSLRDDGKITVQDAWTTTPDTTSFYKIAQIGKFPRRCDVEYYTKSSPYQFFKQIPEQIRRAVAAQVDYMRSMGADYFNTDKAEKTSESISRYSYQKSSSGSGHLSLIAPRAKVLLQGIINRVGTIA